jgi:hypothetical protein
LVRSTIMDIELGNKELSKPQTGDSNIQNADSRLAKGSQACGGRVSSVLNIELGPVNLVSQPFAVDESERFGGSIIHRRISRSRTSCKVLFSAAALVVAVLCFSQNWDRNFNNYHANENYDGIRPAVLSEEWSRDTLAQEISDPDDETVQMAKWDAADMQEQAALATSVGGKLQDDVRIGLVIGHMTQIAFDTVVELKRTIRGLGEDRNNDWLSSKVQVVETMLGELVSKLDITALPPPPGDTELADLHKASRLAAILHDLVRQVPHQVDAGSVREVRFNVAVFDLTQISRELDEIIALLETDPAYEDLTEPAVSDFDQVPLLPVSRVGRLGICERRGKTRG